MAFEEAREDFGKVLRFEERGDDVKTIFLGKKVTGFYIGKKDGVGKHKSSIYELRLEDGQLVSIWGSELLNGKFEKVPLGCMVSVEFLGVKEPKRPGGNSYKDFMVMFDKNTRDMQEATPNKQPSSSSSSAQQPATVAQDPSDEGYM